MTVQAIAQHTSVEWPSDIIDRINQADSPWRALKGGPEC